MAAPEVKAAVADVERRLSEGAEIDYDEMRLLRSAIQYGGDNPSTWLETAAERAATEDQLNTLCELGAIRDHDNSALAYPDFARALLKRARAISAECHKNIFYRLTHVGGARSSENGEPDAKWKALYESIQSLADQHADDPELGPLFNAIAEQERSQMDWDHRRYLVEVENE
jgi:hypothetical protein